MKITNPQELKDAIKAKHGTQADFARALMARFPWRFNSLLNAQIWVSSKTTGRDGMTLTDKMFFEIWFNSGIYAIPDTP